MAMTEMEDSTEARPVAWKDSQVLICAGWVCCVSGAVAAGVVYKCWYSVICRRRVYVILISQITSVVTVGAVYAMSQAYNRELWGS